MGQMPGKGGPSKRWCMWGQKREGRFPVVRKAIRNMKNKNKKI